MLIFNVFYNGKSLKELDDFRSMIIQNHAAAIIQFIQSYDNGINEVITIRYTGDFANLKKSISFKNQQKGIGKDMIPLLIQNGYGDYLPPT